ncbi:MAG: DMT family transporter [Lachnospiraceae bacterium]|nr:DMT family transporter [Lachnospiraceae bacterium]
MADNRYIKEKFIIFLGVVGVSFSGIFAKLFHAPSMYIAFLRLLILVVVMAVPFARVWSREKSLLTPKTLVCCAVSGLMLTLHFASFFEAVRLASVASGSLLINTSVFFVPMITIPCLGERPSAKAWFGMILTFIGSAVVAMADSGGGSNVLLGDALAVFGALCMAVYVIMGRVCRRTMSTTFYTTIVYFFAALATLIIVLAQGIPLTGYEPLDYACAFGLAIVSTLFGHSVFSWGLKYVSAAYIATIKLAEPVVAAILALIIFREMPGALTILGGAVIIIGVAWTAKYTE